MTQMFASAESVLRRANKHITDLSEAIKVFGPDKPYSLVIEHDPNFGKKLLKAKFSEGFSEDISCIMFDAINNMRACLDQMTFAIAVKHRGDSERLCYFPFAKDIGHWPNRINGMKNDVPAEILALFETFQPYKGGNNTLWSLNYIANLKKHAALVPSGFGTGAMLSLPAGMPKPEFVAVPPSLANKNEIILFSAEEMDRIPDIEFRYTIVIDDPEDIVAGKHPVTLLNSIHREVRCVAFDIADTCRQIGLCS